MGDLGPFELDVRDLGGHLDLTRRARAGTLSRRVREAAHGVAAVGALPLGFQAKLRLAQGKYLSAGLHAVEASYVSASSLCAFRAALVRSVWFNKMFLASTPVILNLLDGPVGVDPAFQKLSGLGFACTVSLRLFEHTDCWIWLPMVLPGMGSSRAGFVLLSLPLEC